MLYSLQMSAITLTVPDELAERLRNREDRLPQILELGLRELDAEAQGRFEGAAEVLEFLAGLTHARGDSQLSPAGAPRAQSDAIDREASGWCADLPGRRGVGELQLPGTPGQGRQDQGISEAGP